MERASLVFFTVVIFIIAAAAYAVLNTKLAYPPTDYSKLELNELLDHPESFYGKNVTVYAMLKDLKKSCSYGGSGVGGCNAILTLSGKGREVEFSNVITTCAPFGSCKNVTTVDVDQSHIGSAVKLYLEIPPNDNEVETNDILYYYVKSVSPA